MKRPLLPALTFNPSAATLDLSSIANFDVRNLFAVINLKTGALIYAPMTGYGFSALNAGVLTLAAPLTGMSATDQLMVLYDDGGKPAEDASLQALNAIIGPANAVAWNGTDASTTLMALTRALVLVATSTNPTTVTSTAGNLMLDATGQSILNAIKAQIDFTSLFVTDGTSYFVRRESLNEGTGALTIAFENLDGTAASPTVANLRPITSVASGGTTKIGEVAYYDCTVVAAGIAVADILVRLVLYDTTASTATAVWLNLTQGTTLATAPIPGTNCVEQTRNIGVTSMPKALKVTGSLSSVGDTVTLNVDSYSTGAIQFAALTGSPTGAAIIEATQDAGASWFPVNAAPVTAGYVPTGVNIITANTLAQNYELALGSFDSIRVRCTTAFSAAQAVVMGAYTGIKSTRAGLLPGENHIGEVGGSATKGVITFGPSGSTTFTSGQVILGTAALQGMARVNNGMGYLFGATLALNTANTAQVDVFVFSSQPSAYAAGSTFTLAAADLPKLSKVIHLDDWTAAGAALSFGQPLDKGPRMFRCDDVTAQTTLWFVAVTRGSITLAATTDATLTFRPARN